MWPNPQFPADFVTFAGEILNVKLRILCSDGDVIGVKSTPASQPLANDEKDQLYRRI